jgi:hypothetical protein
MTDDELRARLRAIRSEEEETSYERRLLHGRIDVIRSEILSRIAGKEGQGAPQGESVEALLDRLSDVLAHKGPPPIDAELERLGAGDTGDADEPSLDELPDLDTLSNDELASLVHALARRERIVSDRRQELHRQIEAVRSEHVGRLRQRYATESGAT